MNKNQINHLYMFKAVDTVLSKYEAVVNSLPVLATACITFREKLTVIDSTLLIQEGQITGVAQQKQKEEEEMIVAALRVAAAMYVYAQDTNDLELSAKVKLSKNIKGLNDTVLLNTCKTVLNLANGVATDALTSYGITAEDISSLEKEITDFEQLVTKPRSAVVTRSQATALLADLLKETSALLSDKMDKLILILEANNPLFYNEYRAARIIVDLHGTNSTEDEVVTEEKEA